MPKVSVILDNYNYADFLPQAIESVLAQTYDDFELIIVDDGSTDESPAIINGYDDSRIVKIFKENGGQTSAFNAGFAAAKGDIVAFLDSDDYWYPSKLQTIAEAHKESPLVQHYLALNGNGIYRQIAPDADWSFALTRYGYMYQHSPTSALSFSRELIAPFFPLAYQEEMRGYTDGCLLMMAMTKSKVKCLNDILGFYRVHDKNLNANRTDSGAKLLDVATRQKNFVNKNLKLRNLTELLLDDGQYIKHLIMQVDFGNKPVAIYGTGNSGKRVAQSLESLGAQVWNFVNSNGEGGAATPQELFDRQNEFGKIVIASSAQKEIEGVLLGLGFENKKIVKLDI